MFTVIIETKVSFLILGLTKVRDVFWSVTVLIIV
jgi:hypothetical protein